MYDDTYVDEECIADNSEFNNEFDFDDEYDGDYLIVIEEKESSSVRSQFHCRFTALGRGGPVSSGRCLAR
jgi:hypothetical protein